MQMRVQRFQKLKTQHKNISEYGNLSECENSAENISEYENSAANISVFENLNISEYENRKYCTSKYKTIKQTVAKKGQLDL